MNIKIHKNQYGYSTVKCPFCTRELRTSNGDDILKGLKRHIMIEARNESLNYYLDVKTGSLTPNDILHLIYYKEHTSNERVVVVKQKPRTFDNSLIPKHND